MSIWPRKIIVRRNLVFAKIRTTSGWWNFIWPPGSMMEPWTFWLKMLPRLGTDPNSRRCIIPKKGWRLRGRGVEERLMKPSRRPLNILKGCGPGASGERTSFFEVGLFGGYFRAYRGMVGVLAEMAQKGEPAPAGLQTYGPDPGPRPSFCRVHQGPLPAGGPGRRQGGAGKAPNTPGFGSQGKKPSGTNPGPGWQENGGDAGTWGLG